jgi:hypothetical protein
VVVTATTAAGCHAASCARTRAVLGVRWVPRAYAAAARSADDSSHSRLRYQPPAGSPVPSVAACPSRSGPMKYPPTIEDGTPVSACHRSGSVNVDAGMGTTSTCAPAGNRSAVNAAVHPAGT